MAAALTRQSTGLARASSASERSKRLIIERSTRTLEAENAKVEAELQAAQTEIELLREKVTALALAGGHSDNLGSDLVPLPRTFSEEEKAALLTRLSNIPIEATDHVAAIVKDYCNDEDVDISALPVAALLRIQETLDALTKAGAGEQRSSETVVGATIAQHQRAPPGILTLDPEPSPSKNATRRRRASTGFFQPNPAAVRATPQQAPETNASPTRRARPQDLSRSHSTRGSPAKFRATETPAFHRADETQPSQPRPTAHSSNEAVSRTSTFADLLQEIGEEDERSPLAEHATARPVTFSFVGAPAGSSMGRTSTEQMADEDMNRTSTVMMASPEGMSRTSTVKMTSPTGFGLPTGASLSRLSTEPMSLPQNTCEDPAFVAELQHTVSIVAASGADMKLAARAILKLAKLVQDSSGKVVIGKQVAVAKASGGLLVQALRVYAAVPVMQAVTLIALLSVSRDNVTVCEALCAAGGVDAVLCTMATHVNETRLQQHSLALLSQVAQHGGTLAPPALVGANVVEAIATVMHAHSHDGLIFRYSCTILNVLLCEPGVAHYVATPVWNFGIVQLVQAALPLHVSKSGFEQLRRSAEQLAELMSQAAAHAAHGVS
jgi:hypothetical protein